MDQASQSLKPIDKPIWSKADATKALELFNNGASYGTLVVHFGKTRGSIAGLINRFRQKGLAVRTVERVKVHKARRVRKATPVAVTVLVQKLPIKEPRVRLRLIESDTEVTFAELQPHHCRYPFGDPKRTDFRYCGKQKNEDAPYCKEHRAVVYTGLPQRRR